MGAKLVWVAAHGVALALLGAGPAAGPPKLPSDVVPLRQQAVTMPVKLSDEWRAKTDKLRLFVSEDRGKSWGHVDDYGPAVKHVGYEAPEDGLYWFAVQLVLTDGTRTPGDVKALRPEMKVFVNTSGKDVAVQKSYTELLRENQNLRKRVEELEKQLAERRGGPTGK